MLSSVLRANALICLATFLPTVAIAAADLTPQSIQQITDRYKQVILLEPDRNTVPIEELLQTLSPNGTWPDLDYADKHPARWQPKEHLYRIRSMAIALLREDETAHRASKLQAAINLALDHWLEKKYRCPNWWSNEIGTPQALRDIIFLQGDRLSAERRSGMLQLMQLTRIHGAGANLLWQAEIVFHREMLLGNEEKLAEAVQKIWDEIHVSSKEGIQTDWSFHQHGKRLQSFGYGRSFLNVAVNSAWQLKDTPWQMPPEKQEILSNYLLEGLQWMSRGTYCPPGTFDRVVSRKDSKQAGNVVELLRRWAEVDTDRQKQINAFLAYQQGAAERPWGFRHFPKSDFTAYHHPAGSIFLKTISDRTLGTESIIGENTQGKPYLHSGDHYVVRDGNEFFDLAPVLQWNRLPGITVPGSESKPRRTKFVGGIGNGSSGMTAMTYVREQGKTELIALRKAWFFHGDKMLCLLAERDAAIKSNGIVTTIEQCRLQGPVMVSDSSRRHQELAEGEHALNFTKWLLHHGVGYLPLEPATCSVLNGTATGSWSAINSRYTDPPESVVDRVLKIELPHGDHCPQGFAVLLGADAAKLDELQSAPPWQILRNDSGCQAVRFTEGLTLAAFYRSGALDSPIALAVDSACLLLHDENGTWLCDPTNKGKLVKLSVGAEKSELQLPPGGIPAKL